MIHAYGGKASTGPPLGWQEGLGSHNDPTILVGFPARSKMFPCAAPLQKVTPQSRPRMLTRSNLRRACSSVEGMPLASLTKRLTHSTTTNA